MICPNNNNLIEQSDFDCIGDVAKHCDLKKLCIAINEASDFDMPDMLCDFWAQGLAIIEEVKEYQAAVIACEADPECVTPPVVPDNYDEKILLVCSGSFTACNGRVKSQHGLVRAWVYYAYSRYIVLNGFNDTPNGQVQKTNEWSIPKPLKEVQSFADKYRSMAYETLKKVLQYARTEDTIFTELPLPEKLSCKCGGGCDTSEGTKGYGSRSRIITKEIKKNTYGRL